jgi:hypothetical protein
MRKLIIAETSNSPKVILDPEKKTFQISGESRPPNAWEFYSPVVTWLDELSANPSEYNDPISFNLNFNYFNSSSGKMILDICKILAGLRSKGVEVEVKWYFEKGDNDMLEAGREMSDILKFPFEYIEG